MKIRLEKPRLIRAAAVAMAVLLGLSVLSACTQGSQSDNQEERVLRIATMQGWGGEDEWLRQQFTELYEFANRNVKIEIVPAVDMSRYQYGNPQNQ